MKQISSAANPRYKALRKLVQSSQERRKTGLSVLDGVHLAAAYHKHVGLPRSIAVSRNGLANPEVRALLEEMRGAEILALGDALFDGLSSVATPTGIVAVIETPRSRVVPQGMECCVLLEDLQDPGNLGSILRSCAAAGVGHVVLSKGSVHAWSPRVLRAGMGAHFMLNIHEDADLLAVARDFQGTLVATAPRAPRSIFETGLTGAVGFMFGNEGSGLSAALLAAADTVVSIPMPGAAESLNVTAAAAVCLFERVRQLSAVG
ncbi:MAG TPA: RNA methyltransferase [Burkholderiales bacterium]